MKKIEKLNCRVILDISKCDISKLSGGHDSSESEKNVRTIVHETHVNTCFTRNCCNRHDTMTQS